MKPIYGKTDNPDQPFICVKRTVKPRPEFLWHFHDVFELNLVVKGTGTRFIGDHIGHFNDGDLVLMGPELPHTWCSDLSLPNREGVYTSLAIQFGKYFLGESLQSDPEWHQVRNLMRGAGRGICFNGRTRDDVASRLVKMSELSGPARLQSFIGVVEVLALSQNCHYLASPSYIPALPTNEEKRIDKVCTWINGHYAENITLPEAAALVNMSVSAFSRLMKRSLGKSFTDYLTELRLSQACKLLLETDLTISEAAFRVGFNNLSNFNRRFLERKRVSPRMFRQSYRQS